ncbi:MAG: sulfite exporter TauE/SafE family protein [Dehalococcoidia bacterium]
MYRHRPPSAANGAVCSKRRTGPCCLPDASARRAVRGGKGRMSRTKDLITGGVGGFASGLTGIGGGTVMVPLLTGLLQMPQRRAHATSLVIVIFAALAAVVQYAGRGEVRWELAAALTVSAVVGAQIGARTMHAIPDRPLRIIFSVFLIAVGVRLIVFG